MEEEIWKSIIGYQEYYEVSNLGRIRSLDRLVNHSSGNSLVLRRGKIKKLSCRHDYLQCCLWKDNTEENKDVHRFVAMAFIPNPENKPFVNHKNGTKWDNRAINLEWTTEAENTRHAIEMGLMDNKGIKNGGSKLSNEDVVSIRRLLNEGISQITISEIYNISQPAISAIKTGTNWLHLI